MVLKSQISSLLMRRRKKRNRRKLKTRQTDVFAYIIPFPRQALFSAKRKLLSSKESPLLGQENQGK